VGLRRIVADDLAAELRRGRLQAQEDERGQRLVEQ